MATLNLAESREPQVKPMPFKRPVIGIPADRRIIGPHPFHAVGEKYIRAVAEAAGAIPFLIPALGDLVTSDEILERVDGILFTGSPSNVEPHHYAGPPSAPGTLHDPHRDAMTLPLIPRAVQVGVAGVRRVPRLSGDERGLRRHAASEAARGRRASWTIARTNTQPLEVQYAPVHDVTLEPGGLLRALAGADRLQVNSLHSQGVRVSAGDSSPKPARPMASIEAFRVKDAPRFAVAVQWHPEWQVMSNSFSRALFAAFGAASRERAQPQVVKVILWPAKSNNSSAITASRRSRPSSRTWPALRAARSCPRRSSPKTKACACPKAFSCRP